MKKNITSKINHTIHFALALGNALVFILLGAFISVQNVFNPIPLTFQWGHILTIFVCLLGAGLFVGLFFYAYAVAKELRKTTSTPLSQSFNRMLWLLNVIYVVCFICFFSLFWAGVFRIVGGISLMD